MTPDHVEQLIRPLTHKDLRQQCRARNLNPAGDSFSMAEACVGGRGVGAAATCGALLSNLALCHVNKPRWLPGAPLLAPAGGVEALRDRIKDDMLSTKDFAIKAETGEDLTVVEVSAGNGQGNVGAGKLQNNYARPGGQNVGNIMSDRPSSRVLAAPGGKSQIVFGDSDDTNKARPGALLAACMAGLGPCTASAGGACPGSPAPP